MPDNLFSDAQDIGIAFGADNVPIDPSQLSRLLAGKAIANMMEAKYLAEKPIINIANRHGLDPSVVLKVKEMADQERAKQMMFQQQQTENMFAGAQAAERLDKDEVEVTIPSTKEKLRIPREQALSYLNYLTERDRLDLAKKEADRRALEGEDGTGRMKDPNFWDIYSWKHSNDPRLQALAQEAINYKTMTDPMAIGAKGTAEVAKAGTFEEIKQKIKPEERVAFLKANPDVASSAQADEMIAEQKYLSAYAGSQGRSPAGLRVIRNFPGKTPGVYEQREDGWHIVAPIY